MQVLLQGRYDIPPGVNIPNFERIAKTSNFTVNELKRVFGRFCTLANDIGRVDKTSFLRQPEVSLCPLADLAFDFEQESTKFRVGPGESWPRGLDFEQFVRFFEPFSPLSSAETKEKYLFSILNVEAAIHSSSDSEIPQPCTNSNNNPRDDTQQTTGNNSTGASTNKNLTVAATSTTPVASTTATASLAPGAPTTNKQLQLLQPERMDKASFLRLCERLYRDNGVTVSDARDLVGEEMWTEIQRKLKVDRAARAAREANRLKKKKQQQQQRGGGAAAAAGAAESDAAAYAVKLGAEEEEEHITRREFSTFLSALDIHQLMSINI